MKQLFAFICMSTFCCGAYASEVYGTISNRMGNGAQGALVTVTCGDFTKSEYTTFTGNYYIKNVPDGSDCDLVIELRGVKSKPHSFKTTSGSITFNRRVEPYRGELVFL